MNRKFYIFFCSIFICCLCCQLGAVESKLKNLTENEQKKFKEQVTQFGDFTSERFGLQKNLDFYYMVNFKYNFFRLGAKSYSEEKLLQILKRLEQNNQNIDDKKVFDTYQSLLEKQYQAEVYGSKTFLINLLKETEKLNIDYQVKNVKKLINDAKNNNNFSIVEQNKLTNLEFQISDSRELKNYISHYIYLNSYVGAYGQILGLAKDDVKDFLIKQNKLFNMSIVSFLKFMDIADEEFTFALLNVMISRDMQKYNISTKRMAVFFQLKIFNELLSSDKYKNKFIVYLRNNGIEANKLLNLLKLYQQPLKKRFAIDTSMVNFKNLDQVQTILNFNEAIKGKLPTNAKILESFEKEKIIALKKYASEKVVKQVYSECIYKNDMKKAFYWWQCVLPTIELDPKDFLNE
ncbi:hypothetical protein AAEX28_04540 [Lentisphaerota bacterium WC36G]|nr:hypothetical protein LJT99_07400 [Lentisphaerae bacterium WC36]